MIELREAIIEDREKAYQWLYYSDFSKFLNRLEGLTGETIPSYEKFKEDYQDYYFNGSHPEKGRCYIIVLKKNGIPKIGYVFSKRFTGLKLIFVNPSCSFSYLLSDPKSARHFTPFLESSFRRINAIFSNPPTLGGK